jgi:hypothetical protein
LGLPFDSCSSFLSPSLVGEDVLQAMELVQ